MPAKKRKANHAPEEYLLQCFVRCVEVNKATPREESAIERGLGRQQVEGERRRHGTEAATKINELIAID